MACIVTYYPILHGFLMVADNSTVGPLKFVYLQFGLFTCFGFIQLWEMAYKLWGGNLMRGVDPVYKAPYTPKIYSWWATFFFICLSLSTKSILVWLIISPVLANASNNPPALRASMLS